MKKIAVFLVVLSLLLSFLPSAFATPDSPFQSGVSYGAKYSDNGAVPSMLNFGNAHLSPGESLYDAKTTTLKSIRASQLNKSLEKGGITYYCYAKWQCSEGFSYYSIDAMLVMTTPDGDYYATYDTWDITDGERRMIYSWFFNVTDLLDRAKSDCGGTLPKGVYSFSLFFNDMSFRVAKVKVN